MEVILLEKIRKLGEMGAKVVVKPGHARNHLIPHGKAVLANAANLERFAQMRATLEQRAADSLAVAQKRAESLCAAQIVISVKATEGGKLFGSVSSGVIAKAFGEQGHEVKRNEIRLPQGVIRQTGEYEIELLLHGDVTCMAKVTVVSPSSDSQ